MEGYKRNIGRQVSKQSFGGDRVRLMLYISYEKWTNRDRQPRLDWHLFAADIGSFLCTAWVSWSTQPRGSLSPLVRLIFKYFQFLCVLELHSKDRLHGLFVEIFQPTFILTPDGANWALTRFSKSCNGFWYFAHNYEPFINRSGTVQWEMNTDCTLSLTQVRYMSLWGESRIRQMSGYYVFVLSNFEIPYWKLKSIL